MDKKTKLLIGLGAAVVLLLGILLGTSSGKSGSSYVPDNGGSQSQTDTQPSMSDDELFLALVHSYGNPYVENASDSDLINIGKTTCDTFDSGYSYDEIVNYLAANGDTSDLQFYEMEGIIIGAAVNVYCPEYLGQIS